MPREQGRKVVASNRKARHDYTILDTYEAGMALTGTEVKSLRAGRASLVSYLAPGDALYIGIAVYAVMMSLIGAFYYLRVVKVMYFDSPITATTASNLDTSTSFASALNVTETVTGPLLPCAVAV